jgi:hypothetical protein
VLHLSHPSLTLTRKSRLVDPWGLALLSMILGIIVRTQSADTVEQPVSCSNPSCIARGCVARFVLWRRFPSGVHAVNMLRLASEAAVKPAQRSVITRISLPSASVVEHRIHRQTLNLGEFVPRRCCCIPACCGLKTILRSSFARNASGNARPGSPAPRCALSTSRCVLRLFWQPLYTIFSGVGYVYLSCCPGQHEHSHQDQSLSLPLAPSRQTRPLLPLQVFFCGKCRAGVVQDSTADTWVWNTYISLQQLPLWFCNGSKTAMIQFLLS